MTGLGLRALIMEAWTVVCDGSPGDDGDGAIDLFDSGDTGDLSRDACESLSYLRGMADTLGFTIRELLDEAASTDEISRLTFGEK